MAAEFDPYYIWLGIPPGEQPPHHYRLLGLGAFETNIDVIEIAADRQMRHIQTFKTGQHSAASQKLLNELSQARLCLLRPESKAEYDRQLQAKLRPKPPPAAIEAPPREKVIRPRAEASEDDEYALAPSANRRSVAPAAAAKPAELRPFRPASKLRLPQVPWPLMVVGATAACLAAVALLWPDSPPGMSEAERRASAQRVFRGPGPMPPPYGAPVVPNMPAPVGPRPTWQNGPSSPPGSELRKDEIDRHVAGLKSDFIGDRQGAAVALQAARPTAARQSEVARALEQAASHSDPHSRRLALRALAVWGSSESVPTLLACLDNSDFMTRNEAMTALAAFPDERAIGPVVARLRDLSGRQQAAAVLRKIGTSCEPELVKLLTESTDSFLRREVCGILKDVGTQASVAALTAASQERSPSLARAARDALQSINQR